MPKLFLSTVAFVALAGSAFAADLSSTKAPPVYAAPVPTFSWTGFYIGADVGGAFGSTNLQNIFTAATATNHGLDTSGVLGGGYIGYNYQVSPNFMLGLEGDFQGASNSASWTWVDFNTQDSVTTKRNLNWLASINGRLGYSYDRALFYAIGGAAWAEGNSSLSFANATGAGAVVNTFSRQHTLSGWDIGAGVEYAFTPIWVGRVEYRYYQFGNDNFNPIFTNFTGLREQTQINSVRVGLAYLFATPAPTAPVVAKY